MPTPIEAYRQGYERGRNDSAGGRLAEMTMGMLRDDPGGHFQRGYSDGAAGKPFQPPTTRTNPTRTLPKFSENPFAWFIAAFFMVFLWAVWQLVKAPFLLSGCLLRKEKPSPSDIARTAVAAGVVIALVWWVPHMNETAAAPAPSTPPSVYSVSFTDNGDGTHTTTLLIGSRKTALSDLSPFAIISYNRPHDLVHVMCPSGFRLDGTKSATGNHIILDTDSMAGIEVFPGKPNTLLVTCRQ